MENIIFAGDPSAKWILTGFPNPDKPEP